MLLALIYILSVAALLALCTETEKFGWATLTLIGSLVCAQFFNIADVLSYVKAHALITMLGAVIYLVLGVVWSFCKWFSFLHSFKRKFLEAKEKFLIEHNLPKNTEVTEAFLNELEAKYSEEYKIEFDKYRNTYTEDTYGRNAPKSKSVRFNYTLLARPLAADNKSKIIGWMSFWPFSIIGTLINDPVRRLFVFLFNQLKGFYQKISDFVFKDTELK